MAEATTRGVTVIVGAVDPDTSPVQEHRNKLLVI